MTIERWSKDFGDDYFSFMCRGVFNVVLNSNLISDPTSMPREYEEHMQWFEQQLADARKK